MTTPSQPHHCHTYEKTTTPAIHHLRHITVQQKYRGGCRQQKTLDDAKNPGVPTTNTPGVPADKNPGFPPDDAPANVPDEAMDEPPAPVTYSDDRYPAHDRSEIPQATTNFDLNPVTKRYEHTHTSVDCGYNNRTASMFGSKPIRPTNITLPIRHKALQELMRRRVNLNTWVTLQAVNKVCLLTITYNDFLDKYQ